MPIATRNTPGHSGQWPFVSTPLPCGQTSLGRRRPSQRIHASPGRTSPPGSIVADVLPWGIVKKRLMARSSNPQPRRDMSITPCPSARRARVDKLHAPFSPAPTPNRIPPAMPVSVRARADRSALRPANAATDRRPSVQKDALRKDHRTCARRVVMTSAAAFTVQRPARCAEAPSSTPIKARRARSGNIRTPARAGSPVHWGGQSAAR